MEFNVIFPRKLLKRFILLYKEQTCLWDRTCPSYKKKPKRHEAISKLTTLVQEYDPTATRVHVLRKIESLRACARREYKRIMDSRQKATSEDEVYTPQLWYYELLSFVFGDEGSASVVKTRSPEPAVEEPAECEDEIISDVEPTYEQQYTMESTSIVDVDQSSNISKRLCTEVEDEYDAIGINVAAKLRTLPSCMRILAEKLINDVLFQAQINGLNSSTLIYTSDPFKRNAV